MIWTDRSRYLRGLKHCQRARFLSTHYKGHGLRPKAEALPLATGTSVHTPLTKALEWMRDNEEVPARELFRTWTSEEVGVYKKKVQARGFDEGAQEDVAYIAAEQAQLIEGLCWVAYRVTLPALLAEFRVLDVEREETYVAGCTCGLGDGVGEPGDHEARVNLTTGPCAGVVLMSRPDFILQRRSDGQVGIADLKTSGYAPDFKGEDHVVQIAFGTLGAERRLGKPVTHYYIISLLKGKRDYAGKTDREEGGVRKQQSPLCYAYYRAGDPPFNKDEFRFEYTREKGFAKIPLWLQEPKGMSPAEWWVMEKLPWDVVEGLQHFSPAFQRPDHLMSQLLEEVVAEEREWAWKVEQIQGMQDPQLNQLVRRSWDCNSFYGRSCEFVGICKQESGWERPEGLPRFVGRRPNHLLEREGWAPEKAKALGFSVAEDEGEGWES